MSTLPDIEALAIWKLADSFVTGGRVYDAFPPSPTYPLTVVQRIGGPAVVPRWLDQATLQIDVWGQTKEQARDEAATALSTLIDTEGTIATGQVSGVITGVQPGAGLRWFPDDETETPRYTFTVQVAAHP